MEEKKPTLLEVLEKAGIPEAKIIARTGELFIEYYKLEVPKPDEADKWRWLAEIDKGIARNYENKSTEECFKSLSFRAWFSSKHIGTLEQYYKKHLTEEEYRQHRVIADRIGLPEA